MPDHPPNCLPNNLARSDVVASIAAMRNPLPVLFLAGLQAAVCAAQPPNILLMVADDLGVMDVSPYNPKTFYDTPALQALADSGVRFTAGYAACPVCSPTRSAIMTGQWPARTRNTDYFGAPNEFFGEALPENYDPIKHGKFKTMANRPLWPAPYLGQLAASHTTLAEALKAQGYATFIAGKWHLGKEGSWPEDHGFDFNLGGHSGGGPYGGKKYFSPYGNPRLSDGPDGEHLPDRLASETSKFIASHKDRPFFACLSFYSVHTPLIGRPDLVEKYEKRRAERGLTDEFAEEMPRKNRTVQSHAVYAAMVEAMDQAVGKVLAALEANGVADRTIVIFTSDNGGLSTSEGSPTSNLPLRAGKGWLYEGGIREPLIVRWPGVAPKAANSAWPVTSTDIFPTLLDAAGLPMLPEQHRDGQSFVAALKNPAATNPGRSLFWHYPHWGNQGGIPGAAVRRGDWKLIRWFWKKEPELFNLATDPGETLNLAGKNPQILAELQQVIDGFQADTKALMPHPNPNPKEPFLKW
jgi:arylsulfatase A-like enzyme